jgi:hypoxanthine phosphoribosyltransferase
MADPTLTPISYESFLADLETVAAAIEADDWRPHFLVGIGRGGLVPAAFLSHRTGLPMLSVDHSSRVHEFADALLERLAERMEAGERILFVDDINDSGATLTYLDQAIRARCGRPELARVAVLINNTRSSATAHYWARAIDRAEVKDWFVFPWEQVASRAAVVAEALSVPDRLA